MQNRNFSVSSVVVKGSGYLTDVFLSGSVVDCVGVVYDGVNDKGIIIAKLYNVSGANPNFSPRTWPCFETGLYISLSGTDVSCNIGYRNK